MRTLLYVSARLDRSWFGELLGGLSIFSMLFTGPDLIRAIHEVLHGL